MLIKKVEKRARFRRENRQSRRITHRTDRLFSRRCHGKNHTLQILLRHPKIHPPIVQTLRNRFNLLWNRVDPRIKRSIIILPRRTWVSEEDLSAREIHRYTPPRKQGPFGLNLPRISQKRTRLRRQKKVIRRTHPATRPKPITVQTSPNGISIRIGDQCRPVPRLHRPPPKFIVFILAGCRWHADRKNILNIRDTASVPQRFHHLIKTSRITNPFASEDFILLHPNHLLPRLRPGTVPGNRINLPVMANQPEGLRFIPGGGGVGTETSMKQTKPRLKL